MTKQEFLTRLRIGLSGLPQEEIAERLTFYREMFDDQTEEGLSEEEAVAAAGSVDEIVAQAFADISLVRIAKERIKSKKGLKAWEILLLTLGSPIWFSLLIAAAAVILSLYISWWAVIISLWAVFGSLAGCTLGGIAAGIIFMCVGNHVPGIAMIGAALTCAGLSIFAFFGCRAATKGTVLLTGKCAVWLKRSFMKKEDA